MRLRLLPWQGTRRQQDRVTAVGHYSNHSDPRNQSAPFARAGHLRSSVTTAKSELCRERPAPCSSLRDTVSRGRRRTSDRRTLVVSPGARSRCCTSPRSDSRRARSPSGSTSPPRRPTTTSSTSIHRSAFRPEPQRPYGPRNTPSSPDRRRVSDWSAAPSSARHGGDWPHPARLSGARRGSSTGISRIELVR